MEAVKIGNDYVVVDPFEENPDADYAEIAKLALKAPSSSIEITSNRSGFANNKKFIELLSDKRLNNVYASSLILQEVSSENLSKINKNLLISRFEDFIGSNRNNERVYSCLTKIQDELDINNLDLKNGSLLGSFDGMPVGTLTYKFGKNIGDRTKKINRNCFLEYNSGRIEVRTSILTSRRRWILVKSISDSNHVAYIPSKPKSQDLCRLDNISDVNRFLYKNEFVNCEYVSFELPNKINKEEVYLSYGQPLIAKTDDNSGLCCFPEDDEAETVNLCPIMFVNKAKLKEFYEFADNVA